MLKCGLYNAEDRDREKKSSDFGPLPAYKWTDIYRALRPFLRPFGDSGEGRLDFYHRSLSKAVRKRHVLILGKNLPLVRTAH